MNEDINNLPTRGSIEAQILRLKENEQTTRMSSDTEGANSIKKYINELEEQLKLLPEDIASKDEATETQATLETTTNEPDPRHNIPGERITLPKPDREEELRKIDGILSESKD